MPSILNMSPVQFNLFLEIQDIIGPAHLWPHRVLQYFLHGVPRGLGIARQARLEVATFFWSNGLNPQVFLEWCQLDQESYPRDSVQHYMWLFQSLDNGYLAYRYSWNVSQGHYQYMNGTYCDPKNRRAS